jgi:uncharacterized membrane protein
MSRRWAFRFVLVSLGALAVGARGAGAGTPLKVIDLGGFPGFSTVARGINDRGQVVGERYRTIEPGAEREGHGLLWQKDTSGAYVWMEIGKLGGFPNSHPCGINDAGRIAGWAEAETLLSGPPAQAVMWEKDASGAFAPTSLGTPYDFWYSETATSGDGGHILNERGQIVGSATSYSRDSNAGLWAEPGLSPPILLSSYTANTYSSAYGINAEGSAVGRVIGSTSPGLSVEKALLWRRDQAGGYTQVELPMPAGGQHSTAWDINDRGQIVGVVDDRRPVIWERTPSGEYEPRYMELPPGATDGRAYAINNSGDVVGWVQIGDSSGAPRHAVLWRKGGSGRFVPTDLGVLPGFTSSEAYGINEQGQVVGSSSGWDATAQATVQHAVLWEVRAGATPPTITNATVDAADTRPPDDERVSDMAARGAADDGGSTDGRLVPRVGAPVKPHSFDGDLSALPKVREWTEGMPVKVGTRHRPDVPLPPPVPEPVADPVRQAEAGEGRIPAPFVNFAGIGATGSIPPDVAGDVGPNHYIQMVNTVFAIYSKSGVLLAGPSAINTLWAGFGGACQTRNDGDPIVLYDPIADRWLMSQFANTSPPHQCVAVSKTSNPVAGGYWLYDFTLTAFPDYPKFAVWPDAYYMSANSTPGVYALNRAQMLAGGASGSIAFSPAPVGYHSVMLPGDLDGTRPPPTGAPNTFYRYVDGESFGGSDRIELFQFHVDWVTPANSTFTGPTTLIHAPFASLCGFAFDCIRQPVTPQRLDSITEWPMWRLQYRNHGDHETLVGNHSVNVGSDQAGVRWFELIKVGNGAWTVRQDATWAPDTDSRWMGSIAEDFIGNIAVGYSVSSTATEPSLRYTGRLDRETLNLMTQGEGVIAAGGGHQTGYNRWGDYHSMSVDPTDDCTFWFSGEYYAVTSSAGWATRIAAFRLPLCGDLIFRSGFNFGSY